MGEVEHVDLLELRGCPELRVITYSDTSTRGARAASPWPMPGVSMITTSAPEARQASMTSGRVEGTSAAAPRVARERK
jgi:hypothetical protein